MSGWIAGAIVGSTIIQSRAAGKASDRQQQGNNAAIDEQRAAREQFVELLAPFREFGLESMEGLRDLLFNPEAGLEQINPVVDFLRKEGFEDIQETAAAGGRLGAGGTLKDLTQFNTDLTSTIIPQLQNQRFNQLFNVLSLGQNAAAGQGTGILNTANNISGFQQNIGNIRGQEAINQSNTFTNSLGQFSQLFGANPQNTNALTNAGNAGGSAGGLGGFGGQF